MDDRTVRYLRRTAGLLGVVVAGIHMLHPQYGIPRLVQYLVVGVYADPRPFAFTLAGFFIFAGIGLGYFGLFDRAVYLGGIALCLTFLGGFAVWHTVLDHGVFWPHIESHGHTHADPITVILQHLAADTTALVSKLAEATLAIVLAALYRAETA